MQDQLTANYEWFQLRLPDLVGDYRGKHALIHNQDIAGIFASSLDAVKAGLQKFGEENFSVEVIDDKLEDLGFYSYVSATLHA